MILPSMMAGRWGTVAVGFPSQKGERCFYDRIFIQHYPYIVHFIMRKGFNIEAASDMSQEVFLRAWKAIKKLQEHPNVLAWLCVVAKYIMYDEFKKLEKAGQRIDIDVDSLIGPDTEKEAEEIRALFCQLPPKYREILSLIYEEDLSLEQCAAKLGLSLSAAKTRSSRARKKLLALAIGKRLLKPPELFLFILCHFILSFPDI